MTTDSLVPLEVRGRPRYADAGTPTKIIVRKPRSREDLFVVHGGYIEMRESDGGVFVIAAKHDNATDIEHDSAYVFMLEGAGLTFRGMMGTTLDFSGVIMKGSWYEQDFVIESGAKTPHSEDTDEIYVCEDPACADEDDTHLIMPFTPPKKKFNAFIAEITLHVGEDAD